MIAENWQKLQKIFIINRPLFILKVRKSQIFGLTRRNKALEKADLEM
jgi:hypothetical protein